MKESDRVIVLISKRKSPIPYHPASAQQLHVRAIGAHPEQEERFRRKECRLKAAA